MVNIHCFFILNAEMAALLSGYGFGRRLMLAL